MRDTRYWKGSYLSAEMQSVYSTDWADSYMPSSNYIYIYIYIYIWLSRYNAKSILIHEIFTALNARNAKQYHNIFQEYIWVVKKKRIKTNESMFLIVDSQVNSISNALNTSSPENRQRCMFSSCLFLILLYSIYI